MGQGTSAVCSPSRAGLLTGRYNCEFGYYTNPDLPPDQQPQMDRKYSGLPVGETTIADRLAGLGYINGLIGKWHFGRQPQFHPLKRGFHEFWGYINGGHDYYITMPRSETKIRYRWPIESNYKNQGALTYIADDKGNECVDFIKRHKDEPFFLFASFNTPHIPLQATEADKELYSFVKDERKRTYCAMIHRLDVNVGRIISELKKQNLYDKKALENVLKSNGPDGIDRVMDKYEIDAIIAPTGGPSWPIDVITGDHHMGGSSSPAARSGYPAITLPAGFIHELPVGISLFAEAFSEPKLIGFAFAFEQATKHRKAPEFIPTFNY